VEPRPSVVILEGPNGAGKSTVAPLLLRAAPLDTRLFINADEIAAERSPADPTGAAMWFGTDDDREALTSFVTARLPSWRLNVAALYVVGISGRTFLSFPASPR
jgi:hypothetical protein